MTKKDFIDQVKQASGTELSAKDTTAVIDAAFDTIRDTVTSEGRFAYPGLGTFTVKDRKARSGRNPQTGKSIKIKASKSVAFKPAPALKDSL